MNKLDRLRELLEKATPGTWREGIGYAGITSFDGEDVVHVALADPHNRALIISLHNNADALLRAVELLSEARHYVSRHAPALAASIDFALKELEEGT